MPISKLRLTIRRAGVRPRGEIEKFLSFYRAQMAQDRDRAPVFLAKSNWELGYVAEIPAFVCENPRTRRRARGSLSGGSARPRAGGFVGSALRSNLVPRRLKFRFTDWPQTVRMTDIVRAEPGFLDRVLAVLRAGAWLDRSRLKVYPWILLGAYLVAAALYIGTSHGLIDNNGKPLGP